MSQAVAAFDMDAIADRTPLSRLSTQLADPNTPIAGPWYHACIQL